MVSHITKIRVRYGETDRMGYAHHANYPLYMEEGRTELLRSLGISYKSLEDSGILLPVISININYKNPAFYDDILEVKTFVKDISPIKIVFYYEIYNQRNELLCNAETMLVFVNAETRKPQKAPEEIIKLLYKEKAPQARS